MQACEHPRYGLIVQSNGRAPPGTRLMIDFASDSMNVMPRNSGVSKVFRRDLEELIHGATRIERMFDSLVQVDQCGASIRCASFGSMATAISGSSFRSFWKSIREIARQRTGVLARMRAFRG